MYTTEAIVCGIYPDKEHDIVARLYTKDAGMIYARAGGARAGQSKLRYALQVFSRTNISLVRGRHEWRITGAVGIGNFYYDTKERAARIALLSSMKFLRRLVPGSVVSEELFSMVLESMYTLTQASSESSVDKVFLLRLLHQLGYIAPETIPHKLLQSKTLLGAYEAYKEDANLHTIVPKIVEEALVASHL